MKLKDIFYCWDFIIALILTIIASIIMPYNISAIFIKDVYSIGVSVLSIVFSIYFAALAIIISSSDDDFIKFLDNEGHYEHILNTYKYTMIIVFVTLIYSIVFYVLVSYNLQVNELYQQSRKIIYTYFFLFLYSLFCVFNTTIDAIKYAKYRSKYINIKNK